MVDDFIFLNSLNYEKTSLQVKQVVIVDSKNNDSNKSYILCVFFYKYTSINWIVLIVSIYQHSWLIIRLINLSISLIFEFSLRCYRDDHWIVQFLHLDCVRHHQAP